MKTVTFAAVLVAVLNIALIGAGLPARQATAAEPRSAPG